MMDVPSSQAIESEAEQPSVTQIAHVLLRFVLAVRYRKNVILTTMAIAIVLGGLYYVTATRYYGTKAELLVTQIGPDPLKTTIPGTESSLRDSMPTFENMIRSAKVIEGALAQLGPNDLVDLAEVPREQWLGRLQQNLYAKTIRSTSILEVRYESPDPQGGVKVVQAVVQSYLDFMDKIHKGTTGEIRESLVRERTEQAAVLARKQEELLAARRDFADLGFRSEGKTLHPLVQRAVYFNEALIAVQKHRVDLQASLEAVETAVRDGEDLGQHLMTVGDAVGREVILSTLGLGSRESTALVSLEQTLLADRAQLATLRQSFGPAHPEVIATEDRIRRTEQFLEGGRQRVGQRLAELRNGQLGAWLVGMVRQKLDEVKQREAMLAQRFEQSRTEAIDMSGQLAAIEMLERDVKRLSDMNDVLLNQIASLDLRQTGPEVRVTVTREPVVARQPISPRLTYVAAAALLGGFGIGLMLVHLLDALDDRFRSVEEMQGRLGVSVLTLVRQLGARQSVGLSALPMYASPTSAENEAFRTLRTALELAHPDARQIVVSSPEPGDGKTTVVANLAVGYAQSDKRTLLIDADLRRPGLTALLNLRGPTGLSEILRSDGDVAELAALHVHASDMNGLDVLPSGPRPINPSELLGGPRMSQLLAWAETVYDKVLIDSPPALATSDAAIIGRLVDGAILVVQPLKNRRRILLRVVESLGLLKIPLLGLVVNRISREGDQGYYGYHGGYEYGYGFDPGYAAGYGTGEESEEAQPAQPGDSAATEPPEAAAAEPSDTDEAAEGLPEDSVEEPSACIVPRRAA